jgi:GT2 family glycosyltransferase
MGDPSPGSTDAPGDVGIVIVNWNGERYLEPCLRSIYGRTPIVVVDNASDDRSVALVRSVFPAVTCIRNDRNIGFSAANNVGARACPGDYLLFLNNDTIVVDGAVIAMRMAFANDPRVAVVGARLESQDGLPQAGSIDHVPSLAREIRGTLGLDPSPEEGVDFDYDSSRYVSAVCGAAMMIRRDVFDHVGGWPEEYFAYAEDADLCRRVLDHGYRIWFESSARVVHVHGGSGRVLGTRRLIAAYLISYRSVNLYIRRYQGAVAAFVHAALFPLDVVSRSVRRVVRKAWRGP